MRLASIISRVRKHVKNARELVKKEVSDDLVFNSLAMTCFQAVNSAIDLGEYIVSTKNLGFPAKYREIFELLHKSKIMSKKNLTRAKRLVFLRNLIAHEYYVITEDELREMVTLLDCFEELIKNAKTL